MAANPQLASAAVNAEANAVGALLNGGLLRIYDGTQPANADTAVSTQTLLAELTFGNPAFGAAVGGVATANAIDPEGNAPAGGAATWFRCLSAAGGSVLDGTVGLSGCDLNLTSIQIQANAEVSVSSFTVTARAS